MKKYLCPLSLCLLGPLFLAGCQQRPAASIMPEQQIQQLSALVAASDWLRDNCERRDIPAKPNLLTSAVKQGEARGWKSTASTTQELSASVERRYQAITEDSMAKSEKCATLNSAAAPFLARVTSL
ncbi:hypothetical protein A8A01_24090 [Ewingella americana]|jgi:general secretion pathway protein S|nr:hypothetical protein A8A01_24090 [Ewingella americana]